MPRPAYIICANMVIEDKETGLISALQIVDKLQLTPIPIPQPGHAVVALWNGFVIMATWFREPQEEVGIEYELEARFLNPPNGEPISVTPLMTFRFGEPDPNKMFHRFCIKFPQPPPLNVPGIVLVESRIRRVGTEEWISQTTPLIVEILQPPPVPANG